MKKIVLICLLYLSFFEIAIGSANNKSTVDKSDSRSKITNCEIKDRTEKPSTLQLDLNTSIDIALKNNHQRNISDLSVRIAELQHKQAMSAYWPGFMFNASSLQFDEAPDFIFSGNGLDNLKVKLTDKNISMGTLNGMYPIYTGGMRSAIVKQAEMGIKVSEEDKRRTDLEIVYDVTRFFYSSVLTQKLWDLGNDILSHFEALFYITEKFYKMGSGKVNKIDYLKLRTILASIKALVASLESNAELSKAGLLNTLGLPWDTSFSIIENELPYQPMEINLGELVRSVYCFNPDWKKLDAGLKAMELRVKERKSGYFPKLVLSGRLFFVESEFDAGLTSDVNSDGYTVGLHMQIPVFKGFYTKNSIMEARLNLRKLEEQKILLKEGLATQVKHVFILINRYSKEINALHDASDDASENRRLNLKAYENEIVELESVTESLVIEALVNVRLFTARYKYIETRANLDFILGKKLITTLGMEY